MWVKDSMHTHDTTATDWAELAGSLMGARRTVLPRRLGGPGPDAAQLQAILAAAAAAPDHRCLLPWRFIEVPDARREGLGDTFAQALLDRDPQATPEQVAQARDKAQRSPFLALLVVDTARGDEEVGLPERLVSAGCAVQNVLLMATAMGFGSALTSGKALTSPVLRRFFGLSDGEQGVCFLNIGTALSHGRERVRPSVADYLSVLGAGDAP
jgi:nitroreductase